MNNLHSNETNMDQAQPFCPEDFVKLEATEGNKYFRRSDIKSFGLNNISPMSVSVTLMTSGNTAKDYIYHISCYSNFEKFVKDMANSHVGTPAVHDSNIHPLSPQDTKPVQKRRDLLLTGGAEAFYKWLHGNFVNGIQWCGWSFKAMSTERFHYIACHYIVCHYKPGPPQAEEFDLIICFSPQYERAHVSTITSSWYRNVASDTYNNIIEHFITDVISAYFPKPGDFKFDCTK